MNELEFKFSIATLLQCKDSDIDIPFKSTIGVLEMLAVLAHHIQNLN